jgi:phosphoribosylamine--glycine ligase
MEKYHIPTAAYKDFYDPQSAISYLATCNYPIVIKADGLAAGKGVEICHNITEATTTIQKFMIDGIFHESGKKIVIEEFLIGVEASIICITDGTNIRPLISGKDHKTIYENNQGPNTGGMGVVCPNPYVNQKVLEDFEKNIMNRTINGFQQENMHYVGFIFFGVMITANGCKLLEFNVRMGDPECQSILPLMKSDFIELIQSVLNHNLNQFKLE